MRLDHLAELDVQYTTDLLIVQPYGTGEGTGLGEGIGTLSGERINGTFKWSNLAHRRSDGNILGHHRGLVETDDGASLILTMQTRLIFLDDRTKAGQNLWMWFEAEEERYRWLNDVLCIGEGRLDLLSLKGHIRAFVCINELVEPAVRG